ncbi:MAG TPA: hypothetical protein VN446_01480 [Candidatus Acidoferrum sp.]|nr:hypothetical protein [Candidatus Acidoferrum sp.]
MTEPLFFDSDCLSAFLWVDRECILAKLYPGRIAIPSQIYRELSHPGLNHLKGMKAQVDALVEDGQATVEAFAVDCAEYALFYKLTQKPDPGHRIIDDGEAAAIAMAVERGGILASNNLRDISAYVREYGLIHVTTGDIMKEAMAAGLIDEAQGNVIWTSMLSRRRRLGYPSFSDYLKDNP